MKLVILKPYDNISDILYSKLKNKNVILSSSYEEMFSVYKDDILISSLTIEDVHLTRTYDKRTAGAMDCYPFASMYSDELTQDNDRVFSYKFPKEFNLNYTLIKYYLKFNEKTKIITNEGLPNEYDKWYSLTKIQKEHIIFLHHREKMTRHKALASERLKCEFL